MEYIIALVCFVLGLFAGWLYFRLSAKSAGIELKTSLTHVRDQLKAKESDYKELREKYLEVEKELSREKAEKTPLNILKERWTLEFKNLSQEILDSRSKQFQTQSEQKLSSILNPFKKDIESIKTKIEDTYNKESREVFSLKEEIKQVCEVHSHLKTETEHLTQALKGDVKAQGMWGEMILNTVLQSSGLEENVHYTIQAKGRGLQSEEGEAQRPDAIVKLPDNKDIIIDAKVSLTHYEQFINADSEEEKARGLSLFINSIKSHIKNLSEKKYHLSKGVDSIDLVLMFFPIEGAFSLALQNDPAIFSLSWKHNIVIVSPTTLLATLRTIDFLWKREQLNKNAEEIARASGFLYDKFVSFAGDWEAVGTQIKKAEDVYDEASKKLNSGRGNIVSKLENIRKLGARATKKIPPALESTEPT